MNSSRLKHIKNWSERARQANWSVSALAKISGVSTNTLRLHFHQQMGQSTKAWLNEQRQHQAIELLRDGCSIKETASCLGYKQQTNFTRKFKEFWGECPSHQPRLKLVLSTNERK